jgi:predicted RND superfamily exporter protein
MEAFERRFGQWVVRWRWPIILVTLILVALAASGGRHLHFTTDYRVFFSPENPQLLAFEALENTYTKQDNLMFVLSVEEGDLFQPQHLAAIEWLTEQAWQMPYSTRVDSISNFQHTSADGDDLRVQDLIEGGAAFGPDELAHVREIALNEPLLAGQLISHDGKVTGINVTVQLPRKNEMVEVPQVVEFARSHAAEMREKYPGLEVRLSGVVMLNNAFSEASQGDMQRLIPVSFAVMLVALAILLRSAAATFATTLVIIFSILVAMGLGGHAGMPLSPPTATAPTIILTVAIAGAVHVLVSMFYELRHGRDAKAAVAESLRVNLQPVFLTSLTTALGFLSMNFSEAPPFRHLGNLVATGVVASFFLVVTFLPAVVSLLPLRARPADDDRVGAMDRLAEFVIRRRSGLLWGAGVLIVALVALVPRNQLNDVFPHYFDPEVQFRQDSDFTDRHLGGLYRIDYSLQAAEPGGISDPAFLAQASAFADWWRAQPETIHVNSFTDIMTRLNKNMHGDDPAWHRLPDSRELAAQYLLLYEMSLPYGLDLNNQINVDKSATRLSVTIRIISTREVLALEASATDWLKRNAPAIVKGEGTSPTIMFSHIGDRNIKSMLGGATLALALISMTLVIAMRSLTIGLVSMIPNLAPVAMGFGLWSLFNGEIGLGLSVVAGMTIGIVVDDTVHFLSKYLRARREHGLDSMDAVRYAFSRVGTALWVTSAVLIAGFLVLALSDFQLNAQMGLLSAIVIALALAADFLFLPSLLMKLEEKNHAKTVPADAAVDATGRP